MTKHYLYIILIGILSFACKKDHIKLIKADLTFKSVSFHSAYGATEQQIAEMNARFDSILNDQNPKESDYELAKYYQKLKKYNLAKLPYIFLLLENDSVIAIHVTEKEYTKVKDFRHGNLYKKKKKVVLEIELQQLDSVIYFSNNIRKVAEVDGRSYSNK